MILVSIIVPCYNEESTIELLLEAVRAQTFPVGKMEVVIADGMSTDATRRRIDNFQTQHPELSIQVIENPLRHIPAGLNAAIAAASGQYLVRLDAHSMPYPDYVTRCIAALEAGQGDNVGGVWEIRPFQAAGQAPTWIGRSIAAAAAHPLGVGDALYRYTTQAQLVDTVPFGAYSRRLIEKIGAYDENLLSNEDYEFNTRIRQHGGRVWLDPAIRCVYFARPTLKTLARQYWRYGYWKVRMLQRYPESMRWRQALPPLFTAGVIGLSLLAIFITPLRWLLLLGVGLYLTVLFLAGLRPAKKQQDWTLAAGIAAAIATMHLSWGAGFLWSILKIAGFKSFVYSNLLR